MIRKVRNWFTGEDDPHWTTSKEMGDLSIRKMHRRATLRDVPLWLVLTTLIYLSVRLALG